MGHSARSICMQPVQLPYPTAQYRSPSHTGLKCVPSSSNPGRSCGNAINASRAPAAEPDDEATCVGCRIRSHARERVLGECVRARDGVRVLVHAQDRKVGTQDLP